ncbi:MAG: radical SAM family heme chaperone HemW [Chloracidobacterium sp.]|nr:radical SAM family heme chaperone HemW [Chloracidobacterium sp.]
MAAGIYLHIPFCKSRCSYCDFATDVYRSNDAVERYVTALCAEIKSFASNIDTIYFGGGTPSLLSAKQVEKIIETIDSKFDLSNVKEITMEMNPATVTPETLRDYRALGVNRASFGVQTFDDRALKLLARGHDANDARATFKMLRDAGFENISFDLIAGLPGQPLEDWENNLNEALSMSPEHLSLYILEIHQSTPLAEQLRSGRQPQPDDQLAAEMYELMLDKLAGAGYEQYEISNFSRTGFESKHNTKYWTLDPVFGFGVSAHSLDGKQRYANERDTAKYVEMIENNCSAEVMRETIDLASEFVFLGLRMESGIELPSFAARFGFDLINKFEAEIERLIDAELVETTESSLRLTRKGKLFSNEVFSVFV